MIGQPLTKSCSTVLSTETSSPRISCSPKKERITPGARKPEEGAPSLGEAYTGGPQRTPTCLPTYPQKSLTCSRRPREALRAERATKTRMCLYVDRYPDRPEFLYQF